MDRFRKMMKAKEIAEFLMEHPDYPVYASVSLVNEDEPKETQEFIINEERTKVVAVERGKDPITGKLAYFIGYVKN